LLHASSTSSARSTERRKARSRKKKEGKSPDKNLPLDHYRHLTIGQLKPELKSLSKSDLKKVKQYEEKHKSRNGALEAIQSELDRK
jgi:hypothetical protein